MAVTNGQPITAADLATLASAANAVVGSGRLSNDVSPMYFDGSSAKWGYQTLTAVALVASSLGTGYKIGDQLSLTVSLTVVATFQVEALTVAGGVAGLKVIFAGTLGYPSGGDPTSPATLSGGSGSGAQISFTLTHIGPTADYSFPEFHLGTGTVTELRLVNAGGDFTAGDVLILPDFAGRGDLTVTVDAVDAAGRILTYTVTDSMSGYLNLALPIPEKILSLETTGGTGSGAVFAGLYTIAPGPAWATEMNRLRANLNTYFTRTGKDTHVSGPWPSVYGSSFYYNGGEYTDGTGATPDMDFYYADPNPTVVTASLYEEGYLALYDLTDPGAFYTSTSITTKIRVGGTLDVTLMARLEVAYFETSPGSSVVTGSSTLPGFGGFALQVGSYGGSPVWCALINGTVPPGDYDITASITGGAFLYNAIFVQGYPQAIRPAGSDSSYQCSASTNGSPTSVAGIHDSKDIYKISVPADANNASFGLYAYYPYAEDGSASVFWHWKRGGKYNLSFNVPGFVTYKTNPVSSLNIATADLMPWNLARTKTKGSGASWLSYTENPMLLGNGNPDNIAASNSYLQATPVEGQNEPARWKTQTWFTVGFIIADANGFALFKCTTAGYSGLAEPDWDFTFASSTNETHDTVPTGGTSTWATWQCVKTFKAADTWSASTTWNIGDTIIDSNGNTQTLISGWKSFQDLTIGEFITDANGNTQQVITAGTTAGAMPTWATTLGASTTDGTVVWDLVIIGSSSVSGTTEPTWATALNAITQDATAFWRMTQASRMCMPPAVHRVRPVPRYPIYWESETIAALMPPTTNAESEKTIWGCGNQWFHSNWSGPSGAIFHEAGWQEVFSYGAGSTVIGNQAYGWWIYSVSINRVLGTQKNGVNLPPTSEISVTIGCMRNGAFVAFGTYTTGQVYQVLWPIFTSDALVYQCAERVDVQAVAIAIGGVGVATGLGAISHPICAAFYNDALTLIGLVD